MRRSYTPSHNMPGCGTPSSRRSVWPSLLKAAARGLALAICLQVAGLPMLSRSARADDMMLMEETRREDSPSYGWLFLGLSLVAFGVAVNDYQETEYNVKKAKDAYSNYVAATTPNDALMYRELTTTYSHRAQAYESTTNAALLIGFALAATTIAIFRSDGKPDDQPLLLSDRTIQWTYHF
jgi:hypothetical protein